jgi:DNA repair protein RecO (recombination protein O)
MNQVTAQGVVLSRTDYGEADRIITFLTPDTGKVRVMAKGVRRQKSKLAGGIELFSISDITYIQGRGDLHTLVSSRLVTHFGNIVKDIDKTMFGYEMLKILSRVLEDEGGPEFYELLTDSLGILNEPKALKDLAETSFLLHLMRLLGHLPNLTQDVKGGELPSEGSFQFSFDDMAFFSLPAGTFTQNHIKLLRLLSHNPAEALLKVAKLGEYLKELTPLVRQMSRQYVVSF